MAPGSQKTEPLAVWALVLGLLAFVACPVVTAIPAIITGAKGKRAVDESGGATTGRGMAQAGLILGIVNLALAVLVAVGIVVLATVANKHTTYTDIARGGCFNEVSRVFGGRVDKVDCSMPHDAQATGSFTLDQQGSYPGTAAVRGQADARCTSFARDFVTGDPGDLTLLWYYPSQSDWDAGTRTVLCAVTRTDGAKITGSLGR